MSFNQEYQVIFQNWLLNWNLFVDELYQHFNLSNFISKVTNILDNHYMKPDDKIFTYDIDFICYVS